MAKSFSQAVYDELVTDENLRKNLEPNRAFVRESFLFGGVISNPGKTYHIEFTLAQDKAEKLLKILNFYDLSPKMIARRGQFVVYIKEADGVADVLNIIGAHKSLLKLEELRVKKLTGNATNRKTNFETANITRTVSAAVNHVEAIEYIASTKGLAWLPNTLKEVAELRLTHDTLTLTEIGQIANPPIGKSGVNHRMRKICKLADTLRTGKERTEI